MTRGKDFVESLEKGLRIIEVFQAVRSELTLSDVAERVGITRAAARRYLLTLVQLGYATQEGRHFTLSPKVLILSRSQLGGNPILGAVQSILETIAGKTRESASAAVLNSSEIILVARAQSPRPFSANVVIGTCLPAFRTAMGKVLLSELPENIVSRLISNLNSNISDSSSTSGSSSKIDPEHSVSRYQAREGTGLCNQYRRTRDRPEFNCRAVAPSAQPANALARPQCTGEKDAVPGYDPRVSPGTSGGGPAADAGKDMIDVQAAKRRTRDEKF